MINAAIRRHFSCLSFKFIDLQELHCGFSAPSDLELNQYFYCFYSLKEIMWKFNSTLYKIEQGRWKRSEQQGKIFTHVPLQKVSSQNRLFLAIYQVNHRQLVTCGCPLPDVKRAFLCWTERCGAGTDAAGHHLFPQVMNLCLKATVLYTHRRKKQTWTI